MIEPARGDPFAAEANPVAAPVAPPTPQAAPLPPPPPPPTPPPPVLWRVTGTMTTPEGAALVLLARNGGPTITAAPGLQLDDGFQISVIETTAVHLRHAAYPADVVLPLPPPPEPAR
jgi:hypothetical protein